MSSKTFDFLKKLAQIYLPALGTLYFAVAGIWNLPYGEQIVGTITAVDAFLGACLQISTNQYNKAIDAQLDANMELDDLDMTEILEDDELTDIEEA